MLPTVGQVLDRARTFLGDDDVVGGQDFTNGLLTPHYQSAYDDMFRILVNLQSVKTQTEAFVNLPAFQMVLNPTQAGITDLGTILGVEERGSVNQLNVVNATPGTNQCVIQVNNHNLTAGTIVTTSSIGGLTQDVNGIFGITIQDPNDIILLGCTATGTYTGGGTVTTSPEQFIPLEAVDRIDVLNATPGQTLNSYAIEGVFLKFLPANNVRQLRIIYELSGDAPTSTNAIIQVDDCLDYLALQTAFRVARARDLQIASELQADADWVIRALGNIGVRGLQSLALRRPPFRPRRNQFALY